MKKFKLLNLVGITSIALAHAGWAAGHGGRGGGGHGGGGFHVGGLGGSGFHGGAFHGGGFRGGAFFGSGFRGGRFGGDAFHGAGFRGGRFGGRIGRAGRGHKMLFRLRDASYQYSGQSSAAKMIAIRIDPHIMDARLSHRAAASSLSKSTPDSKSKRRLSG
jgi:hypothetical protein